MLWYLLFTIAQYDVFNILSCIDSFNHIFDTEIIGDALMRKYNLSIALDYDTFRTTEITFAL